MRSFLCIGTLFMLFSTRICGQGIGPPSLAVGAGEVLFEKGQLDAQLIASIISSKQDELKKELANRLILEKLQNGSYTLWYYSKQTIDLLFNETNTDVIEKELMRNAVELMTIVALTELYLRAMDAKTDSSAWKNYPGTEEFVKLSKIGFHEMLQAEGWSTARRDLKDTVYAKDLYKWLDEKKGLENFNWLKYKKRWLIGQCKLKSRYRKFKNLGKKYVSPSKFPELEGGTIVEGGDFLEKPNVLLKLNKLGRIDPSKAKIKKYYVENLLRSEIRVSDTIQYINKYDVAERKGIRYGNLLLDLVFEKCANSPHFQRLGLFQRGIDLPQRELIDNYLLIRKYEQSKSSISRSGWDPYDLESLNKELKKMSSQFGALLKFVAEYSYVATKIDSVDIKPPRASIAGDDINELVQEIETSLSQLKPSHLCDSCDPTFIDETLKLLNTNLVSDKNQRIDGIYYLSERITPMITKAQESPQVRLLALQLKHLSEEMEAKTEKELIDELTALGKVLFPSGFVQDSIAQEFMNLIKNYAFKVTEILNNLDKADSYDRAAKLVTDLGSLSNNRVSQAITNSILNVNDKYLSLDAEKNKLAIDVESAYSDLFLKYAENRSSKISPYFSVGINYNLRLNKEESEKEIQLTPIMPNGDLTGINFLTNPMGDTLRIDSVTTDIRNSAGFIGEKIGIKVKIKDFASGTTNERKQSNSRRLVDRKPIIRDVYGLFYGSGLLYQIDALSSDSSFDSILFGGGLGCSFFNNLDANLTYTVPANTRFKKGFLNFSFDIKITEYLGELSKRRKQNQFAKARDNEE